MAEDNLKYNIINVKRVKTPQGEVNPTILEATIDGVRAFVPINLHNRHYKSILKKIDDGELTIKDAD